VRYVEIIPFLLHNERNFWYWALTYVPIHLRNPQNQKPPNSRYDAYYPDFWVATRPAGNPAYRLSEPTVDPLELYGWNKIFSAALVAKGFSCQNDVFQKWRKAVTGPA